MRSPFRSEATAFRFLLLAVLALAAVAVVDAAFGAAAAAAAVLVAVPAAAAVYVARGRRVRPIATAPAHAGPPNERRLLLLAQEPVEEARLRELRSTADRVLVVASPAVRGLERWASAADAAREQARVRVEATVGALRALDADASGVVGDPDPVQALEDALRSFGGDAIAVSVPAGSGGTRLVARIRERYALPVTRLGG